MLYDVGDCFLGDHAWYPFNVGTLGPRHFPANPIKVACEKAAEAAAQAVSGHAEFRATNAIVDVFVRPVPGKKGCKNVMNELVDRSAHNESAAAKNSPAVGMTSDHPDDRKLFPFPLPGCSENSRYTSLTLKTNLLSI